MLHIRNSAHTSRRALFALQKTQIRSEHVFKMSRTFVPIMSPKEMKQSFENDPTIVSHRLLVSGGFIQQMSSGYYTVLPMGQRVTEKMVKILDRELHAIDGQKVSMPQMVPKELWDISGRWEQSLDQLFTVKDRRNKKYCLAPTHEEVVSFIGGQEIRLSGKKKLPLLIYQVGNKYRDELRPKNGLMRAKEFLMKDGYSFDENVENAFATYDRVVQAYKNIFKAWGLDHVMVDADTGNIGGTRSHEFQVLSDAGEDTVLLCDCTPDTRYAANVEKAAGVPAEIKTDDPLSFVKYQKVSINKNTLQQILAQSGVRAVKVQVHMVAPEKDGEPQTATVIVGPNRDVNVLKIKSKLGAYDVQIAESSEESSYTFVDRTAQSTVQAVLSNTSSGDESVSVHVGDFRVAKEGDLCAHSSNAGCKCSPLRCTAGIEVGHVFYLGQKYSKPFKIALAGAEGFVEMGCFGIGVSRAMQSVVETNNDNDGISWPLSIAPFRACIIPMRPATTGDMTEDDVEKLQQRNMDLAMDIYKRLNTMALFKDEVMYDDRILERPVLKLRASSVIGYPVTIVVGKEYNDKGLLEVRLRDKSNTVQFLTLEDTYKLLQGMRLDQ